MKYLVQYADSLRADINEIVRHFRLERVSDERIEEWFDGLFDLIDSLEEWPNRFSVSEPESDARGFAVRKVNYGTYLAFYHVDDDNKVVTILTFQHGARDQSAKL